MERLDPVLFFSTKKANQSLDLKKITGRVLDSNWYVLGEEVAGFESEFSKYIGVDHCISVANGSDALELALRALNVKPGDKVITVANAGFYSSGAIHLLGASPVYVDVDPETLTLCPKALADAMLCKPAAVIVTHLYGQLAEIEELVRIAKFYDVPVIEDCAQAHGAMRGKKRAGSFADIGCYSFYPTKNLGALGDGGALVTNDQKLASRVQSLRQYGWAKKYEVAISGGRNSRLDEIQAAVLREKLPHLDHWNQQRRSIAARYNDAFSTLNIKLPIMRGEEYVAHLYVIRTEDRARLTGFLKEQNIGTDIHYPIPDHQQPGYKVEGVKPVLPETELCCNTVMSLPCFPGLTEEEVQRVINAVTSCFGRG
jgi:dTDP-4-amino-4,6-dideoxygalactose transaminase